MSKKDYVAIAGIIRRAAMFNHDLETIATIWHGSSSY